MIDYFKQEVFKTVEDINTKIINIRRDIHKHPELSGKEEHTKYLVKGILEAYGFEVKEFEEHHGLIADININDKAKRICIRADMDALPITEKSDKDYSSVVNGVMHACGHDAHTAIGLGTAIALMTHKNKLKGNVRFIFQHSEESFEGGSNEMIESGALDGVDAILALHTYPYLPTGTLGYKYGVMLASADVFEIEIFGKSSHGARPHEGVDAILVTSVIVNSLNHIVSRRIDPLHPAVISLGTIDGGTAPNVICNHVILRGTVRTINHDVRHSIPKMMETSIDGICKSMGATYNFNYEFGLPELNNSDDMVSLVVEEAKKAIGEDNVIDLIEPVMGGEDFSVYLKNIKGAFFRLGTCNSEKETCSPQHNPSFDVDDDSLQVGMKVLTASAIEFLEKN